MLPFPVQGVRGSRATVALVAAILVTSCGKQAPPPARQPPEVAVITVAPRTIPFSPHFVAQTESSPR